MTDCKPVFVIHGVNVRREDEFFNEVQWLNQRIGREWKLIPVYWGDLGANDVGVEATIPRSIKGVEAYYLLNTTVTRVRTEPAEIAAAAAVARVNSITSAGSGPGSVVYDEVEEQWRRTEWLRLIEDPALAEEIGTAIGEALAVADEGTSGGIRADTTRGVADGIVRAFDRVVGSITARIITALNAKLRMNFGPTVASFLGDVFVFEQTQDRIIDRLIDAMQKEGVGSAERPATILAHSLGGVITFTAATRRSAAIHLDRLVTFGSQSAFFHIIREIGEVPKFESTPVFLPPRIGHWLNIWEPLDPLAFLAAGVFRLSCGAAPIDRELPHIPEHTLWTHSSYWTDLTFAAWVRDFLSE